MHDHLNFRLRSFQCPTIQRNGALWVQDEGSQGEVFIHGFHVPGGIGNITGQIFQCDRFRHQFDPIFIHRNLRFRRFRRQGFRNHLDRLFIHTRHGDDGFIRQLHIGHLIQVKRLSKIAAVKFHFCAIFHDDAGGLPGKSKEISTLILTGQVNAKRAELQRCNLEFFHHICSIHLPTDAGLGGNGLAQQFNLPGIRIIQWDIEAPRSLSQKGIGAFICFKVVRMIVQILPIDRNYRAFRIGQTSIRGNFIGGGVVRENIVAGIPLSIPIFFAVTNYTVTGIDTDCVVIWVCQRHALGGSDPKNNPVAITISESGYRFDTVAVDLLTRRNRTVGQGFPSIHQLWFQREIDGVGHLLQLCLAHQVKFGYRCPIFRFLIDPANDIQVQRSSISARIAEYPGRTRIIGANNQHLVTGNSGIVPFFPLCLLQDSSIRNETILGTIIENTPRFFRLVAILTGKRDFKINIQISAFVVVPINTLHPSLAVRIQDRFHPQCLKQQLTGLKFYLFPPEFQIVFRQNLVQLVLHLLRVQSVAIVRFREFRFIAPHGFLYFPVRIVALAEYKPFLGSLGCRSAA